MTAEERTVFRRRNIGFIFQQYNLVPMLDVYENITLPIRLDGGKLDEAFLEEMLKILKIKEKPHQMPETLSGGQQQRAAIARALLAKPAVILADEPTGSLDSETGMEVMGLLRTCAARFHQTVIVVTHQEEVAQMADRIICMSDGRLAADLTKRKDGRKDSDGAKRTCFRKKSFCDTGSCGEKCGREPWKEYDTVFGGGFGNPYTYHGIWYGKRENAGRDNLRTVRSGWNGGCYKFWKMAPKSSM